MKFINIINEDINHSNLDNLFYRKCLNLFSINHSEIRDKFLIGDIENGVTDAKRFQVFKDISIPKYKNSADNCNNCKLNTVCNGGCTVRNYAMNGDVNTMPYSQCRHDQMSYRVCEYIYDKLKNNEKFIKMYKLAEV
jgi:radical SAM protein with 4Fe4S-binding SPASM domain